MLIGGLCLLGGTALCLLIAFGTVWEVLHYRLSGARAMGRIVGTKPALHDATQLNAIVAFSTAAGENIEFKSVEIVRAEDVGQNVEVCYLPAKPSRAEYAKHGEWSALKGAAGALGLGIACLAGGIGVLVARHFLRHPGF